MPRKWEVKEVKEIKKTVTSIQCDFCDEETDGSRADGPVDWETETTWCWLSTETESMEVIICPQCFRKLFKGQTKLPQDNAVDGCVNVPLKLLKSMSKLVQHLKNALYAISQDEHSGLLVCNQLEQILHELTQNGKQCGDKNNVS